MANHRRSAVTYTTQDGDNLVFRYTFNSLCSLEQRLDMPLSDFEEETLNELGLTGLRDLMWAGLMHAKREGFTPEQAGELVPIEEFEDAAEASTEALILALGVDEADAEGDVPGEARSGTGESSSA